MSKEEARRVTIIDELLAGRINNRQAAELLGRSVRQVQRLKAEAAVRGTLSVLHKSRGVKPANTLNPDLAKKIVKIYQQELAGYNFSHAVDVMAEEKGIFVSVSTLSRYLKAAGQSSPKAKRRPKRHRSRRARLREGELVQMDASAFDWLGNGSNLSLHGALDDATGRVLALHLAERETFEGYCELIFQMNQEGHLPREIYADGRTVFAYDSKVKKHLTLEEQLAGLPEKQPQFARALHQINILLIIARSAQAKGGIERLWETLQDRLVKDLKRRGIVSLEQANQFLWHSYIPYLNRKFVSSSPCPDKAYLPKQDPSALQIIFAHHEIRKLDSGLSFSFHNQKYVLPASVNGIKIPASPHDTLTVATSSHIGMQVIFKGLIFQPSPLKPASTPSLVPIKSSCKLPDPEKIPVKTNSPWRKHTNMFFSYRNRDDISPDQLLSIFRDIFPDH